MKTRTKIQKFDYKKLRNREFLMFIQLVAEALEQNNPEELHIEALFAVLLVLLKEGDVAIKVEAGSNYTALRDAADKKRDRMYNALLSLVKSFTYDEEKTELFQAAQRVMRIIRQAGNPAKLSDQAQSYMIQELSGGLETYADDLELMGATQRMDDLLAANNEFMRLDKLCREDKSNRPSGNVKAVRQKINPVYRAIINALNSDIDRFPENDLEPVVTALNAIIKDYELLLALRQSHNKDENGDMTQEEENDINNE